MKIHPVIRSYLDIGPKMGDQWGQAMGGLFSIADVIEHNKPEAIPARWEWHHSPICNGPTEADDWIGYQLQLDHDNGLITITDLVTAGRILDRYCDVLRRNGKDY